MNMELGFSKTIKALYVEETEDTIEQDILLDDYFFESTIDISNLINQMGSILDVFSDTALPTSIDRVNTTAIDVDYKICPQCDIQCKIHETMIVCEKCGLEREWNCHSNSLYSSTIEQCYNTASNSFMTFNIIGTNSYCYNRSFLKTCSDYTAYRTNNNKKEIINRIYQYEGNKPPHNIINAAADLFDEIKLAGYVYRGDGKLGVIGACLYYASILNNLTRTPKDIALIMGIDEKFLSHGDRILQELNELQVITIPTNYKPILDYINQFFPALSIPDVYKDFVVDIIKRAERKHLHIKNESRLTTKVVGAIYLLTRRVPGLRYIKTETISRECNNICKSTFMKYSQLITDNYRIMKKPFRKHKIQCPISWRE